MRTPLRLRSLLFAPASRPDVLAKLPRAKPDGVVLDLEDAVAPSAKADAREHSREAGAMLAREHPQLAVYVRVNAIPTEWFADDIARGVPAGALGVVVPKIESAAQVQAAAAALDRAGLRELSILVGIETVAGVINVAEILHEPRVGACYFGAEDYTADLGGVRRGDSLEVLWPRSRVAAHAAHAGVLSADQVVTDLRDEDAFRLDAQLGRSLGYRGKLCIHPTQVAWANESFSPSPAEVDRARRLIEAFDKATAAGHGAISFEGQMVDEPLARRARAVISGAEV
ncbi:MAG: CoA ester lyase [Acidimicrobiales bacterium]